jgi:GNAT superfamily N-acetyltransferase
MGHRIETQTGHVLDDDPARFDLERAHAWISGQSYWAKGIPFTTFAKACSGSLTVGAYTASGEMVAMARVVTDRATFGWICDVFVEERHRGAALGKQLMSYLSGHPDLQGFRRMHLATRDAHELYRQFGFQPLSRPETWMEIRRDDIYSR